MAFRPWSTACALMCVVALTVSVTDVRAQSDDEKSLVYRALINDALAEFDRGHFPEARALFMRAHEMQPSARTFRGLGLASFELREYAATLTYLEQALASRENPLDGELRVQTEALLGRTHGFVGRFRPNVLPADARMRVDEIPVAATAPLTLDIGAHVVVVDAANHLSETRHLRVFGGEDQPLLFVLAPQTPPNVAATIPPVTLPVAETRAGGEPSRAVPMVGSPARADADVSPTRRRRVWLWTVASVVVVGAASAVTAVLLARRNGDGPGDATLTPNTVAVLAPSWRRVP